MLQQYSNIANTLDRYYVRLIDVIPIKKVHVWATWLIDGVVCVGAREEAGSICDYLCAVERMCGDFVLVIILHDIDVDLSWTIYNLHSLATVLFY